MPPEVLDAPLSTPAAAPPAAPAPVAAPAPAEPPSLRDQLTKQVEEANLFAPDGTANPEATEVQRQQTARQRTPDGKFSRRNADGSEVPSEQQVAKATDLSLDPDVPLPDEGTPQHQEEVATNTDNAPKSWKAVAKERWATTDPVVRAEVHRREREMTKALSDHAPVKKFTETFSQVIQPYAQHYAQSNMTPLQVMNNLMQADVQLSTAPMPQRAQFMAKLIRDYKIDINQLDMALTGMDPATDPNAGVERLINERLAPVTGFIQSETQRRAQVVQRENERAATVLDRMEADTVNFPHMKLVAQDMADVTQLAFNRGVYLTPQQAYARAVALNPEAQAAEQGKAGQQRAHQAHDAATRSLGASLSVSGTPVEVRQPVDPSDLRGTIEAAWNSAMGR